MNKEISTARILKELNRDIRSKPGLMSKFEAQQFMRLFLSADELKSGDEILLEKSPQVIEALARILKKNATPEDFKLLEKGYKKIPRRWQNIRCSTNYDLMDRDGINAEIQYVRRCYNALFTEGRGLPTR